MRFAPESLLVILAAGASMAGPSPSGPAAPAARPADESPQPAPGPSPSPAPTLGYKLIPYGFETPRSRSTVPLLRFEDRAEVRSLEMNDAIARFFDKRQDTGSMLRGATPGGAPNLRDMAPYRPHVTPGANLFGAAMLAVKEITQQIRNRRMQKTEEAHRSLLLAPSPTPAPSPASSPSPSR